MSSLMKQIVIVLLWSLPLPILLNSSSGDNVIFGFAYILRLLVPLHVYCYLFWNEMDHKYRITRISVASMLWMLAWWHEAFHISHYFLDITHGLKKIGVLTPYALLTGFYDAVGLSLIVILSHLAVKLKASA